MEVDQRHQDSAGNIEPLSMPEDEKDALLLEQQQKQFRVRLRIFGNRFARKVWRQTKANLLLILTVIAVIAGIILGVAISSANPSELAIQLISFPGEIFLRALKMLILPLIVFSLLSGLGSLNIKMAGSLGLRTLLYYTLTTAIAVILGIVLVVSIRPGDGHDSTPECTNATSVTNDDTIHVLDSILDLIRNLIPDNLFTATFSQSETEYSTIIDFHQCASTLGLNQSNISSMSCSNLSSLLRESYDVDLCPTQRIKSVGSREGMNILGIIVFTIGFAIVLSSLGPEAEQFIRVIGVLNEAIMRLVTLVMWTSPVGIASIIAGKLLEVDSFGELVGQLGLYMVCVMSGLFIHGCIILPLLYTLLAWANPFKLVRGCLQALLVAFGTSSSSATLPVTIQCLEDNLHYDRRVTRFMLPVGATVNMDGTALYEAIAAVFIAQVNSSDLGFDKIIIIAITATLASIGAAGVPQAGLVTLVIVLTAIGLPAEEAALILAVDWLLDRFRTVVNVFGDCVAVGVVSRFSKRQLMSSPQAPPTTHPSPLPSLKNRPTSSQIESSEM